MAIEDANVISYADLGFDVYGNAFLANPAFLQANPDAVRAFVRAASRGWRDAMADPKAASRRSASTTPSPSSISRERLALARQPSDPDAGDAQGRHRRL